MSYEKKRLAGSQLGNGNLSNDPFNLAIMDQSHLTDASAHMRLNPMQYSCNLGPPAPPMDPPTEQHCTLSTPQPDPTIEDHCITVPHHHPQTHIPQQQHPPQVSAGHPTHHHNIPHTQPGGDAIDLHTRVPTTSAQTQEERSNLEVPVQQEVVMGEDEIEKGEIELEETNINKEPPQPHCFVCNEKFLETNSTSIPFFKTETTKSHKKFSQLVGRLVSKNITPRKVCYILFSMKQKYFYFLEDFIS